MTNKRFQQTLDLLETLNFLREQNGKGTFVRFWTGVAHRLFIKNNDGNTEWLPVLCFKDEALEAVIETLIEVESGRYQPIPLSVYDHNEFRKFDYENIKRPGYQLGEVVIKPFNPEYDTDPEEKPEIGVIIQTWEAGDFRTEMFGNASPSEVRYATRAEIKKYRPELLADLRN